MPFFFSAQVSAPSFMVIFLPKIKFSVSGGTHLQTSVLVCFLFLWWNIDQHQIREETVNFSLQLTVHHWGKTKEAESMKEQCLLAGSSWLAQLPSLYNSAPTTHAWQIYSGLGPPSSMSIKKLSPQTCSQTNLMEATPQLRAPLPRYV